MTDQRTAAKLAQPRRRRRVVAPVHGQGHPPVVSPPRRRQLGILVRRSRIPRPLDDSTLPPASLRGRTRVVPPARRRPQSRPPGDQGQAPEKQPVRRRVIRRVRRLITWIPGITAVPVITDPAPYETFHTLDGRTDHDLEAFTTARLDARTTDVLDAEADYHLDARRTYRRRP